MRLLRRLLVTALIAGGFLLLVVTNQGDRLAASGNRAPPTELASVAVTDDEAASSDTAAATDATPSPDKPAPRPTFSPTATPEPAFVSLVDGRAVPIEYPQTVRFGSISHQEVIPGDGVISADSRSRILVEYVAFLAADGTPFDSTWTVPGTLTLDLKSLPLPALAAELVGVTAGERRRVLLPATAAYGAAGLGDLVPPDADLVFVVDVARVERARDPADEPTFTTPGEAVTDWSTRDIEVGRGVEAARGDRVSVHFVARFAESGDIWESTWAAGFATSFTLGEGTVISGFEEGIEGMAVGGRRAIEVPASRAFGTEGASDRGVAGGDSFVFVVDLLEVGDSAGR